MTNQLLDRVGELNVRFTADLDVVKSYSHDQAPFAPVGSALLVCFPKNCVEVSKVLRLAHQFRIPVVPRGAGSGLAGGANAIDGCIILSLEDMNTIFEINVSDRIARVGPGVVNLDLDTRVAADGLAYLPDPASRDWSTIGGNVATNAGGMCCVKYGVTGDHVLGVECVLADGTIVKVGRRTIKSVAGLDLLHLLIGSEGTLAIITEVTVKLVRRPQVLGTLVASFESIEDAAHAALKIRNVGAIPSLLEILDKTTIRAVDSWMNMGLSNVSGMVLAQFDNEFSSAKNAEQIARECGAIDVALSSDPADASDLLQARKLAYPALERLGAVLLDDVAVPLSQIGKFVALVESIAHRENLTIGIFGHAGDGNMHPTIVHDHGDLAAAERAQRAFIEIVQIAQNLGGTATGEHGVGSIKTRMVANEISSEIQELQRKIKAVFDPLSILNPGRKFDLR